MIRFKQTLPNEWVQVNDNYPPALIHLKNDGKFYAYADMVFIGTFNTLAKAKKSIKQAFEEV